MLMRYGMDYVNSVSMLQVSGVIKTEVVDEAANKSHIQKISEQVRIYYVNDTWNKLC